MFLISGKSVDELTEFCKKLSNGESSGYLSDVSDDSDHDEDGNDRPFNHPFMLKERNEPIVMNIKVSLHVLLRKFRKKLFLFPPKNATPIPPKTAEQTKAILMQFPVSSGQHHRLNESEWVPVPPAPKKPAPKGMCNSFHDIKCLNHIVNLQHQQKLRSRLKVPQLLLCLRHLIQNQYLFPKQIFFQILVQEVYDTCNYFVLYFEFLKLIFR